VTDDPVAAKDQAYAERNMCVAALAKVAVSEGFHAWRGLHVGDPWEDDWRNIVFIGLPTGQVSWHIHDAELPLFSFLPLRRGADWDWDGHDTAEKYRRLATWRHGPALREAT
jgi:hypothetical protein